MSVQVRARREAAAFLSTYVGAQGELLVDTTNNRVQVHDGATPGGWPAARLADVAARTNVADVAYTALPTDRTIVVTSITAARTITLPAASAFPTGLQLLVFDESGACSATNTITLARAGTDTINGAASAVISAGYGYLALESNGAGKWTVVDQTPAVGAGTASRTSVNDANYTALTSDRTIAYAALTAPRVVTLPAASAFPPGVQLFVVDESGACSAANTITIARAGTDAINGATSAAITTAYGYLAFASNGVGRWTVIDQTALVARSNVRQTAQAGPSSGGAPSFLPATSASLTLTAQNISTGANALIVVAAQGSNGSGQNDIVAQLTSNPSWTTIASTTSYLFINAATGATSVQTLAPLYQFGGTPLTANGQFTFDYQAMIGYLGNGTSAVATPLVCVGEAATNASTVTSSIAYAYNGRAVLTQPTLANGTRYTLSHNLGVKDIIVAGAIENIAADSGWVPGDRVIGINGGNAGTGSANYGTYFSFNNKTLYVITGVNGVGETSSTGANAGLTAANWKAVAVLTRGF